MERDSARVQKLVDEYRRAVEEIESARLVFVDETGTHVAMTRTHAWAPSGVRAIGRVPLKGQRLSLTVVGAIALDGVRCLMAYEGATTSEMFLRFVVEALVPSLKPGDVVVMDNLSAHKSRGVREAIEAVGATLIYQPPYHPDLNPIELTWAKLKGILRKIEARTLEALSTALGSAREQITSSDAAGWFSHCGYAQPN